MRFSERYGFRKLKTVIQKESMDDDLRNSLWSALKVQYWDRVDYGIYNNARLSSSANKHMKALCESLWLSFFKAPLDTLPDDWGNIYTRVREFFFKWSSHEVYDFMEFIAQNYPHDYVNEEFMKMCNIILEKELSAYRFVGGTIAEITAEEELTAIDEAIATKISPVRVHLNSALEKLTNRKKPDYRNSIKESISAVEALVTKVTESDKGTLGQLLKIMENKTGLHPALKGAFDKLYGYTSDAGGIRHALLDEDNVTFEQAKFMVVVCSAFINYVTGSLKQ